MKFLNQKGISVTEALVAAGLLGVVTVMTVSGPLQTSVVSSSKEGALEQTLLSVREQVVRMLNNDSLWNLTAGSDPVLKCASPNSLSPCTNTPAASPLPSLTLYDVNGAPSYFEVGFTNKGLPCPAGQVFTSPAGNDLCPFQYTMNYQIICPTAAPCFFPMVAISAQLNYAPQTRVGGGINSDNYGINNFIRGTTLNPTAHTYECFTVQFGNGILLVDPGNTWPPVTTATYVNAVPPTSTSGPSSIWSIGCAPGWKQRGCTLFYPGGTPQDFDHWSDVNGCTSDNHGPLSEWGNGGVLSESCCRLR